MGSSKINLHLRRVKSRTEGEKKTQILTKEHISAPWPYLALPGADSESQRAVGSCHDYLTKLTEMKNM